VSHRPANGKPQPKKGLSSSPLRPFSFSHNVRNDRCARTSSRWGPVHLPLLDFRKGVPKRDTPGSEFRGLPLFEARSPRLCRQPTR